MMRTSVSSAIMLTLSRSRSCPVPSSPPLRGNFTSRLGLCWRGTRGLLPPTERCARPGGTLADALFNIFGRVLMRRQSGTLQGAFPQVPWSGQRSPLPSGQEGAPTTCVSDVVYADDLCAPIVCQQASALRFTVSAVTADTFDVLTPHAFRANLALGQPRRPLWLHRLVLGRVVPGRKMFVQLKTLPASRLLGVA